MGGLHELGRFEQLLTLAYKCVQEEFRIFNAAESRTRYDGVRILYTALLQCGQ